MKRLILFLVIVFAGYIAYALNNVVPRSDGGGSLGIATANWSKVYSHNLYLSNGLPVNFIDTNELMTANSETRLVTQKAIVTYVGAQGSGSMTNITVGASNYTTTVTLDAGPNITLTYTGRTVNIDSAAGGGGGTFTNIAFSTNNNTAMARLQAGTSITMNQTGNTIIVSTTHDGVGFTNIIVGTSNYLGQVQFAAGANIALTQTGAIVNIASTASGGGGGAYLENGNNTIVPTNTSLYTLTSGTNSVISGGSSQLINANYANIGGGRQNGVIAQDAGVGGGSGNTNLCDRGWIGGGNLNKNQGTSLSTIGGGYFNDCGSSGSTIAGGYQNSTSGDYSTIGGGRGNSCNAESATIAGGRLNTANGIKGTVGGGLNNDGTGQFSTVPGGENNVASGIHSLAAGDTATASHNGSFVWSDQITAHTSAATNEFLVGANAGLRLFISSIEPPVPPTNSFIIFGVNNVGNIDVKIKTHNAGAGATATLGSAAR